MVRAMMVTSDVGSRGVSLSRFLILAIYLIFLVFDYYIHYFG